MEIDMKKITFLILFVLFFVAVPCVVMAATDTGQSTRNSAHLDGELNLAVPCLTLGGAYFSIDLGRFNNSAAPFGVNWKLLAAAGSQAASNCVTLDANLNLSIPLLEFFGNYFWLALDHYNNPIDPVGFYWVFKDVDVAFTPDGSPSTATVLLLENKNSASDVAGILSTDQGDMVFLKDLDPVTQKEYIKNIAMLRKNEVVSTFTFDPAGGLISSGNSAMAKKILQATASRLVVMKSSNNTTSASSTTNTLGLISEALSNLLASLGNTSVFPSYASLNTIVSGALDRYIAGEASTIEHYEIDKNLTCVSDLATCAKNVDVAFKAAVAGEAPPNVPDSEKFTKDEISLGTPPCSASNLSSCLTLSTCTTAHGYWYDSSCHTTAQCNGAATFTCSNGSTICADKVCNGTNDCRDGSDEASSICGQESSCCVATNGCPSETASTCGATCCCCPYGQACDRNNPANGCVPM
jgi:hypothetical protein